MKTVHKVLLIVTLTIVVIVGLVTTLIWYDGYNRTQGAQNAQPQPCVIQITNNKRCHLEVVESVIVRYPLLINQAPFNSKIYLQLHPKTDPQFRRYIKEKYPTVVLGQAPRYDFSIGVTLYPKDYYKINHLDPRKHFFISHEYDLNNRPPNVRYLTPFSGHEMSFQATILPFQQKCVPSSPPIFVVQGDLRRRRVDLLHKILKTPMKYPYKILILCRKVEDTSLLEYKQVVAKENLGFLDYHKEMTRVSGILPLVSKDTHPGYYNSKCTSSINYALAYNLICIIDKDLQDIYHLEKAVVYNNPDQIVEAFQYGLKLLSPGQNYSELVFDGIYNRRGWGGNGRSLSGSGSSREINKSRNAFLNKVIRDLGIVKVYDICGDCNWQSDFMDLVPDDVQYFGLDISEVALKRARDKNARHSNMTFSSAPVDLSKEIWFRYATEASNDRSLFIVKEVIQHLPLQQGIALLENIRRGGVRYLAITNHDESLFNITKNKDIPVGSFYPNNMFLPPFNFPAPIYDIAHELPRSRQKGEGNLMVFDLKTMRPRAEI